MPFFIDTSALFKRYQPEKGTVSVSRVLEESNEPIFISSITVIEIISNLKRLCEVDKITTEEQFTEQPALPKEMGNKESNRVSLLPK